MRYPWCVWPDEAEAIKFENVLKRDPGLTVERVGTKVSWWGENAMGYWEVLARGKRCKYVSPTVGEA